MLLISLFTLANRHASRSECLGGWQNFVLFNCVHSCRGSWESDYENLTINVQWSLILASGPFRTFQFQQLESVINQKPRSLDKICYYKNLDNEPSHRKPINNVTTQIIDFSQLKHLLSYHHNNKLAAVPGEEQCAV